MPNRMLRDWTQSDKIDELSCEAERLFTRLIMKADDYGCFWADTRLLKANLFPLKLDKVREADMLRWMAECQKAGLIVLYEVNQKKYLQIIDFKQRLDRAKSKFPLPTSNGSQELVNDYPPEQKGSRKEPEIERAKALVVAKATTDRPSRKDYEKVIEENTGKDTNTVVSVLKEFLSKRPDFVEPYRDYWNIAVSKTNIPQCSVVNDSRGKKLKTRLMEPAFDFIEIIRKVRESNKLKHDSSWFSFDWVFENDKNYLKILEGNYGQ